MSTMHTAKVIRAGEARSHSAAGNTVTILVDDDDLESLSLIEYQVAPGFVAPPALHRHTDLDWLAYVLEGRLTFIFDDGEHDVGPGGAVAVPSGALFAWRNALDEPARMLCVYSPAGFERFFEDVAAGLSAGRTMPEVVPPLWETYGIETQTPERQGR